MVRMINITFDYILIFTLHLPTLSGSARGLPYDLFRSGGLFTYEDLSKTYGGPKQIRTKTCLGYL